MQVQNSEQKVWVGQENQNGQKYFPRRCQIDIGREREVIDIDLILPPLCPCMMSKKAVRLGPETVIR
jgi:hypothetical protein